MKGFTKIASTVALAAIFASGRAGALQPPPTADFFANPTTGVAPLTVDFTDASTGPITDWFWAFGDNTTTDMVQNPAHTYETPGVYTVEEVVSGPSGESVDTQPNLITVIPEPSTFLLVSVGLCICLVRNLTGSAHFRLIVHGQTPVLSCSSNYGNHSPLPFAPHPRTRETR